MKKDYSCNDDYHPLVPDGIYEAQCVAVDSSFLMGKARKLFLHFKITTQGQFQGTKLFMAFNMPNDKKIRPGSKYYKTWVHVNGWEKPGRNTTMSPRIFKNKIFRIKTRTVSPKHNGKTMPATYEYSVVDSIIDVVAAG